MTGVLTIAGENKLAASVGGTPLSLTTIRVGDGNGAAITPVRTMTDLARRVGTAYPIISSARDAGNPSFWRISTEIPAGSGPFVVREIAVFDNAGDMIAIGSHPLVEFTGSGGGQVSLQADIVFPVTSSQQVSVTLTASAQVPLARLLRAPFLSVESASTATPPSSPAGGATYVIAANPTGAWVGQAGRLAQWTGLDWSVAIPAIGTVVHAIDTGGYLRRTDTSWVAFAATEIAAGLIALATAEEAIAGVNATDAITPATLDAALDDRLAGVTGPLGIDRFRRLPFMAVNEVARNAPPASPAENDTFVLGASPSGAWAGRAHQVAQWTGAAWAYAAAPVDTLVRAQDTDHFWQRTDSGWAIWSSGLTRGQALHLGQ